MYIELYTATCMITSYPGCLEGEKWPGIDCSLFRNSSVKVSFTYLSTWNIIYGQDFPCNDWKAYAPEDQCF